ncbi:transposase [Streptomyces sp. NPDC047002]|uniref:transposase n=1 Tax=Streptomyces sp. NPDC047002 TaxID=3155475 RepID=UPI003452D847
MGPPAGEVRRLARGLQPAADVGRGRHPEAGVHRSDDSGRRGRGRGLGRLGRLHDRAGPPAHGRSPHKGAPAGEPGDHATGRSRGGLATKIHLAAGARCRPRTFVPTAGQAGDAPAFPRSWPAYASPAREADPAPDRYTVLADKTYSSRAIREHLRKRGIRAVIPLPHGGTLGEGPGRAGPTEVRPAACFSVHSQGARPRCL